MTTRTIQFLGQGYNSEPVTVTATWNGNTIFNGSIPTVDEPLPPGDFTPAEIMFTQSVELTLQAEIPMSIEVLTGTLMVGRIVGNYANVYTTEGNVTTITSSGPNIYMAINNSHNNQDPSLSDVRSNVLINGASVPTPRNPATTGTWCYQVAAGSTITCLVDLDSGCEM